MRSQGSPECSGDVIWPVFRKKLNTWPSAVTDCRREMIGISKESYWSPLAIGSSNFDIWRHFNGFMTSFPDFYRKNPFFGHCDVIFCRNSSIFGMQIAEIKTFLEYANSFFLSLQTFFYDFLKMLRSKQPPPLWPFCFSISSVTRPDKWKRIVA